MANNLFVSYDLFAPGQNYEKVIETIKKQGFWAKVHKSLWYIKSTSSAQAVAEKVWVVMDKNDSLIVLDTTNNNASWYNVDPKVSQFIQDNWYK